MTVFGHDINLASISLEWQKSTGARVLYLYMKELKRYMLSCHHCMLTL